MMSGFGIVRWADFATEGLCHADVLEGAGVPTLRTRQPHQVVVRTKFVGAGLPAIGVASRSDGSLRHRIMAG